MSTMYMSFPAIRGKQGKRDFYVAVVRSAADEIRALTAPDPEAPLPEQLRQAIEAYLDYAQHHIEGVRAVQREAPHLLRRVAVDGGALPRVERLLELARVGDALARRHAALEVEA